MAFTEYYCDSTSGSNLNGGSTSGAAVYTGVGDSDGTSVFTPSDGSTPASTVSAGMFGSVYVTAGATVAVFVGRVTTVAAGANGAVTFSTTAKAGTFPSASAGAHTITLKVGGAWKGPNGATAFPFNFVANTLTDATGNPTRVNFYNAASFVVSAAMTHANLGVTFEGYSGTPGDGGRAIIDGGTSGASYTVLTVSGTGCALKYLEFKNNGASTAVDMVSLSGTHAFVYGCVFHDCRAAGLLTTSSVASRIEECEFYACNASNTADRGGLRLGAGTHRMLRCVFHDNSGSNNDGATFVSGAVAEFERCVFDTNGRSGYRQPNSGGSVTFVNCDFYNNVASGLFLQSAVVGPLVAVIENCNFVKNGASGTVYGIEVSGTTNLWVGRVTNCGFGSGTQANFTGQTSIPANHPLVVSGSVTYASGVTPWTDPANGDFRVSLAAAKGAGRGAFTETQASYTGTAATLDIGAGQHTDSGGGLLLNSGMQGGLRG